MLVAMLFGALISIVCRWAIDEREKRRNAQPILLELRADSVADLVETFNRTVPLVEKQKPFVVPEGQQQRVSVALRVKSKP